MISKHTKYEIIINKSICDMIYKIQSLVKLLDNEAKMKVREVYF